MPDRVDDLVAIVQALTKVAEEGMSRSLNGYWDIHRWASLTLTDQQFLMWKAATRQYDGRECDG